MYLLTNTEEILDALRARQGDTERQGAHGNEPSLSFYEPRVLHFVGEIHATSQSQRVTMQQNLDKALALPRSQDYADDDGFKLVLITDEDGVAKQLYAKVIEMPRYSVIETGMPESRRFEFTLYASEPEVFAQALTTGTGPEAYDTTTFQIKDGALEEIKDGALPTIQETTGNILEVSNGGNFATPPLLTISGPTTNPVITNLTADKHLTFNRNGGVTLAEGDTLTVNVADYTAVKTSGGSDTNVKSKLSLDSNWWDVLPGTNEITLQDDTTDDLSGQLQIDFRPAWI